MRSGRGEASRLRALVIGATLLPLASADGVAEPVTLDFQLVVHVTETHGFDIPDEPGHEVGIAQFEGLAIFADGRVARHTYAGHFDFVDDVGAFEGYARWVFEDGSRLRSRYVGRAAARPDGGIVFTGSHSDLSGTGAFAGVSGSGSFEGERIDYLADGGEVYQRGRLELALELPDAGQQTVPE